MKIHKSSDDSLTRRRGDTEKSHFISLLVLRASASPRQIFLGSLTSDSSIIGAGPEIPPSFRTRQKCTTMNADAIIGIATQCQMYARSSAFESTIDPPNNPNRTSLNGVIPNCGPNGPSCPSSGVARAMFVPTVTAQNPS